MSLDATIWAWKQNLPATQKIILLSLADRCGEDFTCYPSQKRLEKDTCLNIKTIKANIKKLIDAGLVSDTGKRVGKTLSVKVYRVMVNSTREGSPKMDPLSNEASPILPESKPENGLPKLAQNRAIEPTTIESPNKTKEKDLIDKAFDFIWTETMNLKRKFPNGGSGSKKYAKITFEKLFNKDYFKKHTEEDFKNEVNDLFDLINREAEYSLHNLKSGNPFTPFERKAMTSILNAEEWRN